MLPTAGICYRALASRDARFDGRFFVGVRTTGVYCRPVCPARTPRRENVEFFACAAAAAGAGYRPCRRCRPETAPGTPAWNGTSASVSRALGLIAAGALDDAGVEDLAARVGVTGRHLRRLFLEHLGASPLAVAHTRRVHFAKRLLDETGLPVAEVAFGAGFRSLRRFNAAMREAFERTPLELRERAHGERARVERAQGVWRGADLSLRLRYRPPFDWRALCAFLAPRAIPGVECVESERYRRSVELAGAAGVIEVVHVARGQHVELRVPSALAGSALQAVARVRALFDLDADPDRIRRELGSSPELAALLARRRGVRVPGCWDGFELAVRAVLGQQVSVRAATTLAGRLVRAFGRPLAGAAESEPTWLFPTPDSLASAKLESIGVTGARARALRELARAVASGELVLAPGADPQSAVERLRQVPGVGPWTAAYVAMRALREPDAFPASDLGLLRAAGAGSARELEERADHWRPWRAYAAMLLWQRPAEKETGT